jgi:hypothetical protein
MKGSVRILLLLLCVTPLPLHGTESISTTGRISLRGVEQIDHEGAGEDPSLTARLEIDARESLWRLHSFIEGGWDGAVHDQPRDHSLFKDFSHVYQDNSPFVEFKELYLERGVGNMDWRIGIQRFSWGRLDEYPANDLLNPWDYNRFLIRPIEERKIGVPSVSVNMNRTDWAYQLVWVPWFVPYRLPEPNAKWSVVPSGSALANTPDAQIMAQEPDLPARTFGNGSLGLRMQHQNRIDWAFTLFHGYDPHPVFKTTTLTITESRGKLLVDPGFEPSFHKITTIGADGATVIGDLSLRAEAAYTLGRAFNMRQELWGYPEALVPGVFSLNPVEIERNTLDYGIGADYRLIEDWLLTLQAQQTAIFDRPDSLYDKDRETLLWANLKVSWLNQKIETNLNIAYNPEHGASMVRPGITYILTDTWKVSLIGLLLDGPPQSIFGRYTKNDQVEMTLTTAW